MGRGGAKAPKKVLQQEADVAPAEPAREPTKISNLYDAGTLKSALDDAAREIVIDTGYEEDIWVSNIKLGLGLAAIASALYAQFGPGKFPANWWTVFGCVVLYILLTIAMNTYSSQAEGDAFLVTLPFKGSKGLRVTSRMERFGDKYSLVITDKADPRIEVQSTFHIPNFFHEDGYLAEKEWEGEVAKLVEDYQGALARRGSKKNN